MMITKTKINQRKYSGIVNKCNTKARSQETEDIMHPCVPIGSKSFDFREMKSPKNSNL
jgi:hypothetical protein